MSALLHEKPESDQEETCDLCNAPLLNDRSESRCKMCAIQTMGGRK